LLHSLPSELPALLDGQLHQVEDGETYRLMPEIDPAELTVQLARALEGGDSVTVESSRL
jgi:hypothetical protein